MTATYTVPISDNSTTRCNSIITTGNCCCYCDLLQLGWYGLLLISFTTLCRVLAFR